MLGFFIKIRRNQKTKYWIIKYIQV